MERNASVDRALEQTIGLDTRALSEEWMKALKREYWPLFRDKQEPEQFARRMTDHWEERAYFFQQPSISPDGRFIAFFSDFEGLVDLFVMDAIDGKGRNAWIHDNDIQVQDQLNDEYTDRHWAHGFPVITMAASTTTWR